MFSNVAGEQEKTFEVAYSLIDHGDVCCCPDYIFLAHYAGVSVHVYSWTGYHIQTLSHQQLGIWADDMIRAIQCNHDGTVLQLATGADHGVYSLHA